MKFVRTGELIKQGYDSLVDYLADGYIDYEDVNTCICQIGYYHTISWHGEDIFYPVLAFVKDHYEGDDHYEPETIDISGELYLTIED